MPTGNPYQFLDSKNLLRVFDETLEATMETIWAPRISVELPSNRETEELGWLGNVPAMRRFIGGRKETTLNKYTLTVKNFPYEATLPISIDDLRRDKTGQIERRIADLAVRTVTHWNSLLGNWIAVGAAATNGLAYDGQFFFDTDHNESGTNQTNNVTVTEVPAADVATTSTLTSTEAANIITQSIAWMMGLTDDQGEPINQAPMEVLILCTKVGHYNGVKTALGLANLGTGSGNNNPLLAWQQQYTINVQFVPQRVTAADVLYFFFGNPTSNATPLIRTNEQDVTVRIKDESFDNRRQLFGVDAVRGVAYGSWQKALKVTLS